MLTGIDHLVIAVVDPDRAAAELEATLGLRATGGGRHEKLGTFNRLIWLGDSDVELAGVFDADQAAESWLGRPVLAALGRGGGLAAFALSSDALQADVEQLRAAGSRMDEPMAGERQRPDGRIVRWQLALPPELGPDRPPFLIEHDPSSAEWTPEDRSARAAETHPIGVPVRLVTLEIRVSDVAGLGFSYLAELGLGFRPSLAGGGSRDTSVGSQTIRLRPVPMDWQGVRTAVHLRAAGIGKREATLFGCQWLIG